MTSLTRRAFLQRSLAATAGLSLPGASWAQVVGANEAIRIGVVGFGSRGQAHIDSFRKLPGVRIVALCDADENILAAGAKRFTDRGEKVATYRDVRQLLDSHEVDAVSTATPNHWHALIAVWACQAGKDVYVEKPVSHNVWEGRQIVAAARKHRRIVQTGTQSRSRPGVREVIAEVQAGKFGRVRLVRGLCYKPRLSIGKVGGPQPIPPGVDYNLWCGPAPMKPLHRKNLHYDWHWVYDTGNGDLGNQGVHEMDIGRWALNQSALPPRVLSVGGRLGYDDDGETPNTHLIFLDYPTPFLFEVRGLPRSREFHEKGWAQNMDAAPGVPDKRGIGVVIQCEAATVFIPSESAPLLFDREGKQLKSYATGGDHFANFIQAVRRRDPRELTADILEGHLSSALCHLGLISHRVGRAAPPGEIREQIQGQAEASETFGRMQEHLAANGVKLAESPLTLGAWLKVNTGAERFVDQTAANALLTRDYRQPFVVPERV
jgi:predicted dehydrogenase